MNILIVGNIPLDLSKLSGGVQAVIVNLLEGITNREVKVDVISFSSDVEKYTQVQYSSNIRINHFPYGKLKSTKFEMLFHGRMLLKNFIKKHNPELVHFQGNGSDLLLSIGLDRDKVIITPHAILREELKYQASIRKKINHLIVCFIESLLLPKCKQFVFISNYSRDYFFTRYKILPARRTKFSVIYNPIASAFFTTESAPDLKPLKIAFVGALIPRKGLHVLLEALNIVKNDHMDFHLDIVGDFLDDNYRENITAVVQSHGLSDFITFHGWKSQGDVRILLAAANYFVLPSFQETLPVSIAEALAAGKIVISSRVGAVGEMIEHNVNGFLFDKGDSEGLAGVFNKLEGFDLQSIARNAKASAQKYHPGEVAAQTFRFYQEILQ